MRYLTLAATLLLVVTVTAAGIAVTGDESHHRRRRQGAIAAIAVHGAAGRHSYRRIPTRPARSPSSCLNRADKNCKKPPPTSRTRSC